MKKRVSSILLALAMLLSLLPASVWAAEPAKSDTEGLSASPSSSEAEPITAVPLEEEQQEITEEVFFIADEPLIPGETGIATFALTRAAVSNNGGSHVKWVDRIDFPTYITDPTNGFLAKLEAGLNNGALIDYTKGTQYNGSYTISIPYTNATPNDAMNYVGVAYSAFLRDHPEIFWLSGSSKYIASSDTVYFILHSNDFDIRSSDYAGDASAITADIAKRNQQVNTIMSGISSGASDYEKVKHFNAWLTEHNGYNSSSDLTESAIGPYPRTSLCALEGNGAGPNRSTKGPVCEGYSKAFKVLCDAANIPCVLVDGSNHMWNNVQIDGKWYAVDVTFNDPIITNAGQSPSDGTGTTKWLLVGSDTMNDGRHVVANQPSSTNGTQFTNGPVLEIADYVPLGNLVSIAVTTQPTKKTYTAGENFDPAGMVVTGTYEGGTRVLSSTEYTITGGTNLAVGTAAITVKCGTITTTLTVTVTEAPIVKKDLSRDDVASMPAISSVKYDGIAKTVLPATLKSGITADMTGALTVLYNGSAAAPVNAGTYTVTMKCAGGTHYNASEISLGTLEIEKAVPVITAPSSVTVGVNGTADLGAVVTPDVTLTYSSDNTGIATVNNGVVKGIAEGTANITITAAGNDNVDSAVKVVRVTVNPVQFKVNGADATAANTLTVKANPSYGDTWADLVQIKSGIIITAIDGDVTDTTQSHFALVFPDNAAGTAVPAAGTYTVSLVYTSGTKTADVCSVSVTVPLKSAAGAVVTVAEATFTGEALTPAVTVVLDGNTLVKGTDYTLAYSDNINAGTGTVTVTFTGNYTSTAEQTFTIAKQQTRDIMIPSVNILAGSAGQSYKIDLSAVDGCPGLERGLAVNTTGCLAGSVMIGGISCANGVITLTAKDFSMDAATANEQIIIPVTACGNYEGVNGSFNIVLTLAPISKLDAGVSAVTANPVAKTYGDGAFTLSAKLGSGVTGTAKDWTWSVDNSGVVSVNGNGTSAAVTILKAGTAKVTASFESDTHVGSVVFTVNVAKKAVTIGPKAGSIYTGSTYTPLDLSGLTAADQAKVKITPTPEFTVTKNGTAVALADIAKSTGTYKVAWSNLKDDKGNIRAVLSGIDLNNYTITLNSEEITVTVSSRPSSGSSGGSTTTTKPTTTETTNPDGSVTKTTTSSDGTVTKTTTRKDGSQTVVETKKDGTVTTTDTAKDGTVTKTVENPNGSSTTTLSQLDGVRATTSTDKNGKSASTVTLPSSVVAEYSQGGGTIALPIPDVYAASSSSSASTVTINPASNREVTVEIPLRSPSAGIVAVTVGANGQEQVVRTCVPTKDGVAIQVTGNVTVKLVDNSKSFSDVRASDWFRNAVDYASSRSLFSGVSSTQFAPDTAMSRGMLAVVIHNLEYNPAASVNTSFTDVGSSAYYAQAISWAANRGLISGYGDGRMGPDDPISREQLAVILWNYAGRPAAGSDILQFNDASSVSDWARSAMIWATQKGIINGVGNGNLAPKSEATRAQVAQMLMTYMQSLHA